MRILKITFFLLFLISNLNAQQDIEYKPITNIATNIYKGFTQAVEWYDLPLFGALYYRNIVNSRNIGDKIIMTPAAYERELSAFVGQTGRFTAGSMNKNFLPDAVIYTRLAGLTVIGMFDQDFPTPRAFQKIFLFQKSLTYTYLVTEYTKNLIKRTRPDGTNDRSFFSGHTSTTFAAATFLWLETNELLNELSFTKHNATLRKTLKFFSLGTLYGWASYVGYSRLRDNKHYLSDVLVGATVGTLVSWYLYDSYLGDKNLPADFQLFPSDEALNFGVVVKL